MVVGYSTNNCRDKCLLAIVALIFRFVHQSLYTAESYRGNRGIAPLILNLGTKWRCMLNFTTLLLYFQEGTPAPLEQAAGWYPKPVLTLWEREESFFFYWDLNSGPSSP